MNISSLFLYFSSFHAFFLLALALGFSLLLYHIKPSLCYWVWLIVLVKLLLPVGLLELQTHPRVFSPSYILGGRVFDDPIHLQSTMGNSAEMVFFVFQVFHCVGGLDPSEGLHLCLSAFILVWVLLSVQVAVVQLYRFAVFHRRLRKLPIVDSGIAFERLAHLSSCLGLPFVTKLKTFQGSFSPCTIGLLNSHTIILPQSLIDEGDEDTLDVVIAHELAHIQNRDIWLNLLRFLCLVMFHAHPVRILADRWFDYHREIARDLEAMRLFGIDRRKYVSVMIQQMFLQSDSQMKGWALNHFVEFHFPRVARMKFLSTYSEPQSAVNQWIGILLLIQFALMCMISPIPY